jgi:hypothetical protein
LYEGSNGYEKSITTLETIMVNKILNTILKDKTNMKTHTDTHTHQKIGYPAQLRNKGVPTYGFF